VRQVAKRNPPSKGIAGENWQKASLELKTDLKKLEPKPARKRARQAYEDRVNKDEVRAALAAEQVELCAFCESRISPTSDLDRQGQRKRDAIRIAHWTPIDVEPSLALTWKNLFASCSLPETCDNAQGNTAPALKTVEEEDWSRHLDFQAASGAVVARSGAPQQLKLAIGGKQGDEWERGVWNLNHQILREARKIAVDTELQQAKAERDGRGLSKVQIIEQRIRTLESAPLPYQSAVLQAFRDWMV
jgi:uncharacterized protein (TIGR02646 family)